MLSLYSTNITFTNAIRLKSTDLNTKCRVHAPIESSRISGDWSEIEWLLRKCRPDPFAVRTVSIRTEFDVLEPEVGVSPLKRLLLPPLNLRDPLA